MGVSDGEHFLPSFGIGCVICAPVFSAIMARAVPASASSPLVPSNEVLKETLPWGMLSGLASAMAIYLVIKAMDDIDYVVANTVTQCSVFVTGLWGWLLYGEFSSPGAVR